MIRYVRWVVGVAAAVLLAGCGDRNDDQPADDSGESWVTEKVAEGNYHTSIALDSNGRPHIVFLNGNSLEYAVRDGGLWQVTTVDSDGVDCGEGNDIAVGPDGHPHISYTGGGHAGVKYAFFDGSWHTEFVDTRGHLDPQTTIAIGSDGIPHMAYYDETSRKLRHAWRDSAGWHREDVTELENLGCRLSLALDSQNRPHIAYGGYANSSWYIEYARWTGGEWQVQAVDAAGDLFEPALAIDSQERPHISYCSSQDGSGAPTHDLMYACLSGSAWQVTVVDSVGKVGQFSSIAVDRADRPHISYVDYSNYTLKYAHFDGGAWQATTVNPHDSIGVAWQTSIAVDADGHPHISYIDYSDDSVRYAHR